ncbi:MAG: APC family permease, partial [Acidobacteriota bacterium]
MSENESSGLERTLTLRGAVTLNLLDMIGVGPFITLPLLLGAMGGPQAMLGWFLGAGLAVCDGLVWAELGAAMPEAGGTYAYLREMFGGKVGRWLSFLFVFQLCLSAPLSVASGCIGLGQYATFLSPGMQGGGKSWTAHLLGYSVGVGAGPVVWVALAAVALAVVLLYRSLKEVKWLAVGMLVVVLVTIAWAIGTGVVFGHWARVVAYPAGAWRLDRGFFVGLGSAMLIATYDYWGYYNVTFLGGEAKDPGRTIPRAVLISIAIVGVLYVGLNASVLAVMGSPAILSAQNVEARRALLSTVMQTAYAPVFGEHAG